LFVTGASDIVLPRVVIDEAKLRSRLISQAPLQAPSYNSNTLGLGRVTKAQLASRERQKEIKLEPLVGFMLIIVFVFLV